MMLGRTRVAVVGSGPTAESAAGAVRKAPDLDLVGTISLEVPGNRSFPDQVAQVTHALAALPRPHVAILAVPNALVPSLAQSVLAQGTSTVDGLTAHGDRLWSWRKELDDLALAANRVAVTGAGWDPGTNSLIRCLFSIMAPEGANYTRFYPAVRGQAVGDDGAPWVEVCGEGLGDQGIMIERTGPAGALEPVAFRCTFQATGSFVADQVMAAASRAAARLEPGAYTLAEIALIQYLPGPREDNVRRMV